MKRFIIFLMSGICLVSCSVTRFRPVQRDTTYVTRVDSVTVYDSVYIDRIRTIKEKADTVYITDWKTEYKYKYLDRVKVDTLILTQKVTETQLVEKELTWWQNFRLRAFWWLLGVLAINAIIFIVWIVNKFK